MRTIVLAVFVALFAIVVSDPCVISTPKGDINLNNVAAGNGFYKSSYGDYNYYLNICGAATGFPEASVCSGTTDGSKGYQVPTDGSKCFPMTPKGNDDVTAELVSKDDITQGVKLTYATYTFDNYERTTIFTVMCDDKASTTTVTYKNEDWVQGHSTYYFDVKSPNACPGAGPAPAPSNNMPLGQLGVGGLIMILLFSFLALYFIIGALVLKFGLKKKGKEIIPNFGFWVGLLVAIKDGPLLFVDLIK